MEFELAEQPDAAAQRNGDRCVSLRHYVRLLGVYYQTFDYKI